MSNNEDTTHDPRVVKIVWDGGTWVDPCLFYPQSVDPQPEPVFTFTPTSSKILDRLDKIINLLESLLDKTRR